jgi:hypothetical protein
VFILIKEPTFKHQCQDIESEEYQKEYDLLFIYLDRIYQQDNERKEHLDGFGSQIYQLHLLGGQSSACLEHGNGKPPEYIEEYRDERIPLEIIFRPTEGKGSSNTPTSYKHEQGVPSYEMLLGQ